MFFTYTKILPTSIELPIGPYNDIEEEEKDGRGRRFQPAFSRWNTPEMKNDGTPPPEDDDFKVYDDEFVDETIVQNYVISPGYKVLFATLGGNFNTTYQRIKNQNVLVKNILSQGLCTKLVQWSMLCD